MSSGPKVIAVTVNWNRGQDTLECISSILEGNPGTGIIVVDNGSHDGSVALFREKYPDLDIIENSENLGYVKGVNAGITLALNKGAEYVMTINNDAIAHPGMVSGLLYGMERHSDAGIVGPKIFYYGSGDIVWFKGGHFNRFLGYPSHPYMDKHDDGKNDDKKVEFITGCIMMVRTEVFRKLGLFDPDYEIYSEDLDFCLKAMDEGWASWVIPSVAAEHKVSTSTGVAGSNTMTPYRSYFCGRNMMILLGKRFKGARLVTCLIGQVTIRMPYFFLLIIMQGEKGALKFFIKGFVSSLKYWATQRS
ncbi:MAG: glycosyltransferase family 2 protein [Methanomassiliicoccales archaeon]|nr:glycosyltransferase family 2 protein [Methanomassiliicoccales archaeon]